MIKTYTTICHDISYSYNNVWSPSRPGVSSLAEAEDRSLLCDFRASPGCSWSARYGGAVPWRQRKTSTASLNTLVWINVHVITLSRARLVPGRVNHLGAKPGTQVYSA